MRTTLYEKVFIDGFHKASYVVATVELDEVPSGRRVSPALLRTLEHHPRLRSLVRFRLGVPHSLDVRPAAEWLDRGGLHTHDAVDLRTLEESLLSTQIDLRSALPLEVHLVARPAALVLKVHHAFLDGASGFGLFTDFARAASGLDVVRRGVRRRGWRSRLFDAMQWAKRVQLRPRIPDVSLTASYTPRATLEREPVSVRERVLPRSFAAFSAAAHRRQVTFSELMASAVFTAMNDYNRAHSDAPPPSLGLMLARARLRSLRSDASYTGDTCVVSAAARDLDALHAPATLANLRAAVRDPHHGDLALALLYASRKLGRTLGKTERDPSPQSSLLFTLSDLTAFGGALARPESAKLGLSDLRVLASPTSFDHAGMIVSRVGDDLRLSVVAHRGALDGGALLDATVRRLRES